MPTLYHYTCAHGCQAIGETGLLLPMTQLVSDDEAARLGWRALLIWLTDLDYPFREALGLTSYTIGCDRTVYRYRVTDSSMAHRYVKVRRNLPRAARELETAPGAMPMHWWVSYDPVPVVYDPAMEGATNA